MAERIQFTNPLTEEVYQATMTRGTHHSSSSYGQEAYRIALDDGEVFDLSDLEMALYKVKPMKQGG